MISQKFTSEQVLAAEKILSSARRAVIITHVSPDGDAMGSSLGMYHYLRSLGKEATVIVPNAFPSFLAWMPGADQVVIADKELSDASRDQIEVSSRFYRGSVDTILEEADAIIVTDLNELHRTGLLGEKVLALLAAKPSLPLLVIDHHILSPTGFELSSRPNTLLLSYPDSPSASELVYRLILSLSAKRSISEAVNLSPFTFHLSTCLYTGMMTDTGNFSYNSNHPEMYEIVSDLVRAGVDKDKVYNAVFNQYSADRMKLMGYCLYQKMRIFPEYHAALIYLSGKELYRFKFQSGDAEGIVNLPLQISDVYYSCFMREDKVAPHELECANGAKTKIKVSFRSQGDRPVNIFAGEIFHGGGHANAAGGEFFGPLTDAVQAFLDNYPHYFLQS